MAKDNPPEWMGALRAASDLEEWLTAISNVDDVAVEGLLRLHDLDVPVLRTDRLDVLEKVLEAESLTTGGLETWRAGVFTAWDAVHSLNDFRRRGPVAEEFCGAHGLNDGTVDEMMQEICKAMWLGKVTLRAWVEFLDVRRDEADRHLFLYELPDEGNEVLEGLRKKNGVSKRLEQLGLQDLLKTHDFVWRPSEPQLVAVNHDAGTQRLILRWVGWREWYRDEELVEEQRCVTFARINLGGGEMVLQLQRMPRGGQEGLMAERDLYEVLTAKVLGVRPKRVRLEPPMHELLRDGRQKVSLWRVRLPGGGDLGGTAAPGLLSNIQLVLQGFYALRVKGEWAPEGDELFPVDLDSRTDSIKVFDQCGVEVVDGFLAVVREEVAERAIRRQAPPPDADASTGNGAEDETTKDEDFDLRALVERLLAYLRELGHFEVPVEGIDSDEARRDLKTTKLTLNEALDAVGVKFAGATYYVLCPETQKPVRQGGQDVLYERLRDVPKELDCDNHLGGKRTHKTADNVWLRVGQVGDRGTLKAFLLAAAASVGLIAAGTLSFVWLLDVFTQPDQQQMIRAGFGLAMTVMCAFIVKIYGQEAVGFARRMYQGISSATQESGEVQEEK